MSFIIVFMCAAAVLWGYGAGTAAQVGAAAMEGAGEAVDFCLEVGALICLWSGVLEVLRRAGVCAALGRALSPALRLLFPKAAKSRETMDALTMNVSANLMGLGNAATPMGIKASRGMAGTEGGGRATDELCMLVCVNTASIQLLPTTVASVRAAAGAAAPIDILPAVWLSSLCSVAAAIASGRLLAALWRRWRL